MIRFQVGPSARLLIVGLTLNLLWFADSWLSVVWWAALFLPNPTSLEWLYPRALAYSIAFGSSLYGLIYYPLVTVLFFVLLAVDVASLVDPDEVRRALEKIDTWVLNHPRGWKIGSLDAIHSYSATNRASYMAHASDSLRM